MQYYSKESNNRKCSLAVGSLSWTHLDVECGDDVVDFAGVAHEVEGTAGKSIHDRI